MTQDNDPVTAAPANEPEQELFGVDAVAAGARFHRVDLHTHSFGCSKDVADTKMTPARIVETAIDRGIAMIALTDHNRIDNVEAAIKAAKEQVGRIVVLPAVEISTAQGHVLAIYPPEKLAALNALVVRLDFQEDEQGDLHTRTQIDKVAELVAADGALCIPAHIDRDGTGFERKANFRDREAIVLSPNIAALEIDDLLHAQWYSANDQDDGHDERSKLLAGRMTKLGDPRGARLPKVLFSDAHRLEDIGRDRKTGAEKITRVKMDTPSFEALKTAFLDPDARIRLEADLPLRYPRIVATRFIGGFLDGEQITFSTNLTCLIGGRGTGKSTALDAVRWACSASASSEMIGKDNWPQRVELCYEDEFGQPHWATREAGRSAPYEKRNGEAIETDFLVEGYEQDRTARIIRAYESDPRQLLDFLDQFTGVEDLVRQLGETDVLIEENARELAPLRDVPRQLNDARTQAKQIKAKIAAANKSNLKEALRWRRVLLAERRLRESIDARLREIEETLAELDVSVELAELAAAAGIEDLAKTISHELLMGPATPHISGIVADYESELDEWKTLGETKAKTLIERLGPLFEQWKASEQKIEERIEAVTQELLTQGIQPDLQVLNDLATAEDRVNKQIRELEALETRRKTLADDRRKLLDTYRKLQSDRFQRREQKARELSRQLKESIELFKIDIEFQQGEIVDEYERWLRPALDRRFIRGDRIARFCRAVHPIDLAGMAAGDNWRLASTLKDKNGVSFLDNQQQAREFVAQLREADLFALERICVDDQARISLTVKDAGGAMRHVPFEDLSFGQKASILLGTLLFSEAQFPLVIDQPEDHLDSQFIFEAVVQTLRRVKERRQVVVATHNANIAVLGDAELLVPLRSWQNRGQISDRGSVDASETRKRACMTLEGGEVAYKRRGEMYGFTPRE